MGATTFWLLEQELKARKAVQQTAESTDKQEGQESIDFETLSDDQLKEIAKDRGIPGYFNMKRDTLLIKLKG
ncbi:hypothetical protein V5785_06135 [Bacillus subtilis]